MLLFPRRLQLSCTRKLTGNITRFVIHFTACFWSYFTVIAHMRCREAVNIDQGNSTDEFPPDEMLRACVELTRAILGQSALAQFVIITDAVQWDWVQWWRLAGFPCREDIFNGDPHSVWLGAGNNSLNYNKFTGLGRCCDRAWLLPDRQQLLI